MTSLLLDEAAARAVAEDLLDRTGLALKTSDFALFSACFAQPLILETLEGQKTVETEAQLEESFDNVREYYRKMGVTELVRCVVQAQAVASDEVQSIHHTLVLSGQILIQSCYQCFSSIKRHGDEWKITQTKYTIVDQPEHVAALIGDPAE